MQNSEDNQISADLMVGARVRELRKKYRHSLKSLAELTGLNINTLSLLENGRISPSVSTLQRLAQAMDVTIASFFEEYSTPQAVLVTRNSGRPRINPEGALIENLTDRFLNDDLQAYVITLDAGYSSGEKKIRHEGYELVYCLQGRITYLVGDSEYLLEEGDSIVFDPRLNHCWENKGMEPSRFLLVIMPLSADSKTQFNHFKT